LRGGQGVEDMHEELSGLLFGGQPHTQAGGGCNSFSYSFSCSVADPGCLSRIPDPTFFHPGSRILIKEFKYFNPKKAKKWFLSSKKYDPDCLSRIQGSKRHPIPDPGPGSATLKNSIKLCGKI
jgi:hypothetical protein